MSASGRAWPRLPSARARIAPRLPDWTLTRTHDRPFAPRPALSRPAARSPGVAPRVARARYKDVGPLRPDLCRARRGHDGRRRHHPEQMPLARGGMVPRRARRSAARARWWSTPATRTPSPAIAAARRWRRSPRGWPARLGCQPSDVFVASTGVIGVPLPIDKAEAGIDAALAAPRPALGGGRRDDHDDRHLRQGAPSPRAIVGGRDGRRWSASSRDRA